MQSFVPQTYMKLAFQLHPDLDERDCLAVQAMVQLVSCWRQKKIQSEIYYNQHSMKKNPARCEVYLKRRFRSKKSQPQHLKKQTLKPNHFV